MKKLFHLSTIPRKLGWFEEDWDEIKAFTEKNKMDGIELGLTVDYDISKIPENLVEGVHLTFYPMWLDFWYGRREKLNELFESEKEIIKYYGGLDPQVMVESYKNQYKRAKALGAKYMVFHVSHALPEDSFSWNFDYTDEDVMKAALELINAAFEPDEDGPVLLFENLWWPGLNYLDPKLTKWFIEQVNYTRKGFVVDVSHLILTNPKIGREEEAYTYIKEVMEQLGETTSYIKGVHLNKTLPKFYMQRDHSYELERYKTARDKATRNQILKNHINKLDGHAPFDHVAARKIIDCINPEFCVYETAPNSRYELAYFIKKQNIALGIQ